MFPKRGAIALVTTALALILLFQVKTPTEVVADAGVQGDAPTASGVPTPATTGGSTTAAATSTVTGSVVSTRYGDVEVSVTIASGKVTDVQAVELPSGGRSGQISSYASPILASEALTAQSASIDVVSGATYTSEAYAQSLQAALDQAGITTSTVSG